MDHVQEQMLSIHACLSSAYEELLVLCDGDVHDFPAYKLEDVADSINTAVKVIEDMYERDIPLEAD